MKEFECPFCGRIAFVDVGPKGSNDSCIPRVEVFVVAIECVCGATIVLEADGYSCE
jgi:hypothetical protein